MTESTHSRRTSAWSERVEGRATIAENSPGQVRKRSPSPLPIHKAMNISWWQSRLLSPCKHILSTPSLLWIQIRRYEQFPSESCLRLTLQNFFFIHSSSRDTRRMKTTTTHSFDDDNCVITEQKRNNRRSTSECFANMEIDENGTHTALRVTGQTEENTPRSSETEASRLNK